MLLSQVLFKNQNNRGPLRMKNIIKFFVVIFLLTACSKIDIKISDDEILKENTPIVLNTTPLKTTEEVKEPKPILDDYLQYVDKQSGFKIQCPSTYLRFDKLNLDLESNKNLLISEIGQDAYEQILLSMNNTSSVWYDFESQDNNYPDSITLIITKLPSIDVSFIQFEDFKRILTDDFIRQYNKNTVKTNVLSEGILLESEDNKFVIFHYLQEVRGIGFSYYQAFTTSKGYIYHMTFTNKQDNFNQDLITKILATAEIP